MNNPISKAVLWVVFSATTMVVVYFIAVGLISGPNFAMGQFVKY